MNLTPGTKLGPYEILSLIGAGGMGEVWKARDTRLGRTVAIKALNKEHMQRFEHFIFLDLLQSEWVKSRCFSHESPAGRGFYVS
jgi:serine/threonine protein kinase